MNSLSRPKNPSVLFHCVWALAVAVAFCIGRFGFSSTAEGGRGQTSADMSRTAAVQNSSGQNSTAESVVSESKTPGQVRTALTGAEAKERFFHCLSEPDRIKRMQLLCELLPLVNKDNWREVEAAFAQQGAKEFRIISWEQELMIERFGQVVGAEAVEEALAAGNPAGKSRAASLIRGWASAQPKEAMAWFNAQTPELQKSTLGHFLSGLALKEPKQAMETLLQFGSKEQNDYLSGIIKTTIQRDGFTQADRMYRDFMTDGNVDVVVRGTAFLAFTTRRFEVANQLGLTVDHLDWFDPYLRADSPVGPTATGLIISDAARKDALGTAKWLDERDSRLTAAQQKSAYSAVAQSLVNSAPDKFVGWMEQHATHPQYDGMVQATTERLVQQGKTDDASRLVNGVQDETLRTKLQASLAKQAAELDLLRRGLNKPAEPGGELKR